MREVMRVSILVDIKKPKTLTYTSLSSVMYIHVPSFARILIAYAWTLILSVFIRIVYCKYAQKYHHNNNDHNLVFHLHPSFK